MAAAGRTAARLVALATLVGLCAGDAWGAARSLLRRRPADALPRTGRIVGAAPDEPLRLGSGCGPAFVGLSTDVPVPADYTGDGVTDRAVFRPDFGGWYVDGEPTVFYGRSTDVPLPLPAAVYRRYYQSTG